MDITFMFETMKTLLAALPMTLALFSLSVFFGGLLALLIVWMRVSGNTIARNFAKGYIFVFRGSPLLIQMFLIFYGLGQFGFIRYSFLWPALREPFVCAVLSLALCTAGYTAEIFRFGLRAIPAKEIEAARSVGMSGFLLTRRILAPVAFRHALPAYSTEVVMMVPSGPGLACQPRASLAWLHLSHRPCRFSDLVSPPSAWRSTWSMLRIGASQPLVRQIPPSRVVMNSASPSGALRERDSMATS